MAFSESEKLLVLVAQIQTSAEAASIKKCLFPGQKNLKNLKSLNEARLKLKDIFLEDKFAMNKAIQKLFELSQDIQIKELHETRNVIAHGICELACR